MKILFIRLLLTLLLLQTSSHGMSQTPIEVSPATRTALGISVSAVTSSESFAGATASAIVISPPGKSHSISSPFPATLIQPLVVPGMRVEIGQDVAELQSTMYSAALADFKTKRLNAEHTQHLAKRAVKLQKLGLRSEQEVEEANHDANSARFAYQAIKSQFALVRDAGRASSYKVITPVSGLVTHIALETGDRLDASMALMTIFTGQEYWAKAQLPERLVELLVVGAPVSVLNSTEPATVVAIDPEVDRVSRSIEVLLKLPASAQWRLGQLTTIEVETRIPDNAVLVPANSVIRIEGQELVFVETEEGFRPININTVARSRDKTVVIADLTTSDSVATSGLAALKNIAEGN